MIMEQISVGTRILNMVLRAMVVILIGILSAVVVCIFLAVLNII